MSTDLHELSVPSTAGPVLPTIEGPADLRALDSEQLSLLASEIRTLLVETVSRTGGLAGYPSRGESPHDWIENSHASTALSYADGMAKAFELTHASRPVVAVIGDGGLTGGLSWEALNNIAASHRPVVIVINDNGRSYAPTVGGLAAHLGDLRKGDGLAPNGFFEDLGLRYIGPVDGHDLQAVEDALTHARLHGGPIVVHCVTSKGRGYLHAEHDRMDRMHQSTPFDPATGTRRPAVGRRWTEVFSQEMAEIGANRPDVVAVTSAMCEPTGLAPFAQRFPERFYDVGIAEQHALTSAAGLASAGLHPVVALYSTFLNRAFDQLLMDVALHHLPVTVVLDRAGITGDDGPSHHGIWDLALLGMIPGLRLAAPRDEPTLRSALREAVDHADGPTVVRFPKTALNDDLVALRRVDGVDVLVEPSDDVPVDVLLIAIGSCCSDAVTAAGELRDAGVRVRVVDPRWVTPIDPALMTLAQEASLVVTIEDGVLSGGVGSRLSQVLRSAGLDVMTREIGIRPQFLPHGKVADLRGAVGLTAPEICRRVLEWCGP